MPFDGLMPRDQPVARSSLTGVGSEGVGPGTFVFIPPGAVHGFRTGPEGGRLLCLWPSTVEAAFFGMAPPNATEV